MKKILLAGVAVTALAVAAPANAADLRMPVKAAPIAAPAPYFSWTGCYVGVHVGHGWGKKDNSNTTTTEGGATSFLVGSIKTSGEIFGGQLGCNWGLQSNLIIGIEGSVSGANIAGFGEDVEGNFMHAQTTFLASITGKLGWSGWRPDVLFYLKGGAAWAHDRYQFSYSFGEQDRSGWTIGVGVEWVLPFAPSWTVFVEYDHYDFGTERATVTQTECCSYLVDVNQQIDTFRIGANYRFNVGFLDGIGKGKLPIAARY